MTLLLGAHDCSTWSGATYGAALARKVRWPIFLGSVARAIWGSRCRRPSPPDQSAWAKCQEFAVITAVYLQPYRTFPLGRRLFLNQKFSLSRENAGSGRSKRPA